MVTILQKNIMVRIDDVYQKVLAIANKEQRGYITPQEFNLFSDQAQMDIFEEYFYELDQLLRVPGNDHQYADRLKIIEEKLQFFERNDGTTAISNYRGAGGGGIKKILPSYIYRVMRVELNNLEVTLLNVLDFNAVRFTGPLLRPTNNEAVANIRGSTKGLVLRVVGSNNEFITPTGLFYYIRPERPNWNYVVVNNEALYNPTNSINFQLHPSEETNLVNKILQLAGITMGNELYQVASQEEVKDIQQEKA